jgi:uncharacterized membrane protein YkoI
MPTTNAKSLLAAAAPALALILAAAVHTPAQAAPTPATAAAGNVLSLDEIERRATAQGVQVKEIKLRDRLVEVEGRDADAQKVELLIDRRSGEVLSRETKPAKGEKSNRQRD